METILRVRDNSGGLLAKCIKVYKKKTGNIGDKILVSIQKIRYKKNLNNIKLKVSIENHVLYKAIIINTKLGLKRRDGRFIKFNENSIILLTRIQEKLIGTRVFCPVLKEFRNKRYMKLLMVGSRLV